MRRMGLLHPLAALVLLAALLFSQEKSANDADYGVLVVTINGFRNTEGQARVYLFNSSEGFPSHPEKAVAVRKEPLTGPELQLVFGNLPFGEYAVAAHHDVNGNDKLDHNWMYMPREPYGASNGARGKFGAPKFDKAKFNLNSDTVRVTITVR